MNFSVILLGKPNKQFEVCIDVRTSTQANKSHRMFFLEEEAPMHSRSTDGIKVNSCLHDNSVYDAASVHLSPRHRDFFPRSVLHAPPALFLIKEETTRIINWQGMTPNLWAAPSRVARHAHSRCDFRKPGAFGLLYLYVTCLINFQLLRLFYLRQIDHTSCRGLCAACILSSPAVFVVNASRAGPSAIVNLNYFLLIDAAKAKKRFTALLILLLWVHGSFHTLDTV